MISGQGGLKTVVQVTIEFELALWLRATAAERGVTVPQLVRNILLNAKTASETKP